MVPTGSVNHAAAGNDLAPPFPASRNRPSMSARLLAGIILLAALLAAAVCLPFITTARERRDFYAFEAELTSDRAGQTQVFFDIGKGTNEADSFRQPLRADSRPAVYRYPLPTGTIRSLRFDPIDREGTMTINRVRIVDRFGGVVATFDPADFRPAQQIQPLTIAAGVINLTTDRGAGDPITEIVLKAPIRLPITWKLQFWTTLPAGALAFGGFLLLAILAGRLRSSRFLAAAGGWVGRHPLASLGLVVAIGVAVQNHPVVFFGRSFVSPDNASYLLYDTFPTLPGYVTTELEDAKGSDVAAILLQHLYYPLQENRALLKDGELPLWNRDNLGGVPLLGQGQTMFGEALNLIPLLAHSASWAWDAKFILAHWLYGFGIALAIFLLTRHWGVSALLGAVAGYVGFFAFRVNHPAQFSVCLSPWILVAYLWISSARNRKSLGIALVAWMFANWEVLASGTIKEAYMLLVCLNLAGLLLVLLDEKNPWRDRWQKLGAVAATGIIFLLLSAPLWLVFLDTLALSQTSYNTPAAMQVPWWQFLGFFEDLFYRELRPGETHANPSANVLILVAVAWLLVRARTSLRDGRVRAVVLAAALPLGIVFGFIPASILVRIPFIANIHHTDNTFSCSLLVLATVLAGPGLLLIWQEAGSAAWWRRAAVVAAGLGLLAWVFFSHAGPATYSPFFRGYAPTLAVAIGLGLAGLGLGVRPPLAGVRIACIAAALFLLLWRHGQYLSIPFDAYVFNPKVRVDLRAPSAAVADIQSMMTEPSRPAGIGFNLFSGYHQMLGWEGIYGVDALRNGAYDDLALAGGAMKVRWWDAPPETWQEKDLTAQLPVQDLLNVRYYLATHADPARELAGLTFIRQHDLDVYESPTAWPRAFFTDQMTGHVDLPDFIRQLRTGDRRPFASVDRADAPAGIAPLGRGLAPTNRLIRPAENYVLTTNTTSFRISAPGPGFAVLTESYYPRDFSVTLDGEPAEYFRVNHAFKGVRIPAAGTYTVQFSYWPHRLTLALWLCAAGIALLAAGLAWSFYPERRFAGSPELVHA